ncbi:hypothetical protein IHE44_0002075 [Lamprotornis superbus]|uniref:Uncharacterized protein n=1 Tax=Lamprotornis superbus TaxID=245042 RepID=A0A835NUP3_9PASS|nr:hypothetical protein IHE44_0002075 [Lamprotornis superbus]
MKGKKQMWVTQSRLKNASDSQAGKEPEEYSLNSTANNTYKPDKKDQITTLTARESLCRAAQPRDSLPGREDCKDGKTPLGFTSAGYCGHNEVKLQNVIFRTGVAVDLELDLPSELEAQRHLQESPMAPEAAWASLQWLPEVIIQEQLALEVLRPRADEKGAEVGWRHDLLDGTPPPHSTASLALCPASLRFRLPNIPMSRQRCKLRLERSALSDANFPAWFPSQEHGEDVLGKLLAPLPTPALPLVPHEAMMQARLSGTNEALLVSRKSLSTSCLCNLIAEDDDQNLQQCSRGASQDLGKAVVGSGPELKDSRVPSLNKHHYQQQITAIDNSLANKMKDNAADIWMPESLDREVIQHRKPAPMAQQAEALEIVLGNPEPVAAERTDYPGSQGAKGESPVLLPLRKVCSPPALLQGYSRRLEAESSPRVWDSSCPWREKNVLSTEIGSCLARRGCAHLEAETPELLGDKGKERKQKAEMRPFPLSPDILSPGRTAKFFKGRFSLDAEVFLLGPTGLDTCVAMRDHGADGPCATLGTGLSNRDTMLLHPKNASSQQLPGRQ